MQCIIHCIIWHTNIQHCCASCILTAVLNACVPYAALYDALYDALDLMHYVLHDVMHRCTICCCISAWARLLQILVSSSSLLCIHKHRIHSIFECGQLVRMPPCSFVKYGTQVRVAAVCCCCIMHGASLLQMLIELRLTHPQTALIFAACNSIQKL